MNELELVVTTNSVMLFLSGVIAIGVMLFLLFIRIATGVWGVITHTQRVFLPWQIQRKIWGRAILILIGLYIFRLILPPYFIQTWGWFDLCAQGIVFSAGIYFYGRHLYQWHCRNYPHQKIGLNFFPINI